jgi:hypothetical protein
MRFCYLLQCHGSTHVSGMAKRAIIRMLLIGSMCYLVLAKSSSQHVVVRGWLSDSQCARARASSGLYTQTNPECARKCVNLGRRIVLIDPDDKRVVDIDDPEIAAENLGNYVEITGAIDKRLEILHITSLRLLERGRALCARPARIGRH